MPYAHIDEYAGIWAKLMGFPVGVPRNWFARTREDVVLTDTRAIADEQNVIDLYADTELILNQIDAQDAFDDRFIV